MSLNSLKFSKCALEENLFSSNHRAQVVENPNCSPHYKLAELQQEFRSQPWVCQQATKVWTLIGKKQTNKKRDPVTWVGGVWENPIEAKNFDPSDSHLGITQAHIFGYSRTCYL